MISNQVSLQLIQLLLIIVSALSDYFKGMPSVLSNQSTSVAYVTPWRQEISHGPVGQIEFHDGDGFVTPPTAGNSGSTSLSSSDESAAKWDSLLRAKDGLICQKDQIGRASCRERV